MIHPPNKIVPLVSFLVYSFIVTVLQGDHNISVSDPVMVKKYPGYLLKFMSE